jgi:hypothetical protein
VFTPVLFLLCFPLRAMDGKIKQHACIKFCMMLGKSATKTLEMLHGSFEKHYLSQWHSHLKVVRVSLEDDKRSGHPNTSKMTGNVQKIRELIHEHRL